MLPVPVTGIVIVVMARLDMKMVAMPVDGRGMVIVVSGVVIVTRRVPELAIRREMVVTAVSLSAVVSPAMMAMAPAVTSMPAEAIPGLSGGGSEGDCDNTGQCDFQES